MEEQDGFWVGGEQHAPPACWDGILGGLLLTVWIHSDTALILLPSYFQYVSSNFHEKKRGILG